MIEEKKFRFEGGAVVQLPSGGPPMTVNKTFELQGSYFYECVWFDDDDGTVRAAQFGERSVVAYVCPKR